MVEGDSTCGCQGVDKFCVHVKGPPRGCSRMRGTCGSDGLMEKTGLPGDGPLPLHMG